MCVIKRVTADDAVQIYTTAIQPSSGALPVLRAALWLLRLS